MTMDKCKSLKIGPRMNYGRLPARLLTTMSGLSTMFTIRGKSYKNKLEMESIMNKQELVTAIADKTRISQKDTAKALDAVVETIKEAVCSGDKVTLVGFGTFEARDRAARTGRNPQTGEAIEVKACKVPAFKAGKAFKEVLN